MAERLPDITNLGRDLCASFTEDLGEAFFNAKISKNYKNIELPGASLVEVRFSHPDRNIGVKGIIYHDRL